MISFSQFIYVAWCLLNPVGPLTMTTEQTLSADEDSAIRSKASEQILTWCVSQKRDFHLKSPSWAVGNKKKQECYALCRLPVLKYDQ